MLQNLQRPQEALEAYAACIAMKEDFPQAYINRGLLFEKLRQDAQALQTWLSLVSRRYMDKPPSDEFLTMALNHMGRLQEKLRNYAQAEQALEESLSINPAQPGVIQHWVHIRQKACQWPIYKSLPGVSLAEMKRYTSPLAMLALTEAPAEQLLNSQSFVARTYSFREEHLSEGRAYHHGKAYELFAYDFSPEERTPLREHLKAQFDHFRSIKELSDRQAAELMLADEIDILIDLHGLSSGARPGIFALHPAPRQGTYLGFMGPTGMPWFDFVIADRNVLPDELAVYFTEKPLHVEGSDGGVWQHLQNHTGNVCHLDATLAAHPGCFALAGGRQRSQHPKSQGSGPGPGRGFGPSGLFIPHSPPGVLCPLEAGRCLPGHVPLQLRLDQQRCDPCGRATGHAVWQNPGFEDGLEPAVCFEFSQQCHPHVFRIRRQGAGVVDQKEGG
jgi:predicted O-linked N-acetylglucosamine transferase (SPINDLY family)